MDTTFRQKPQDFKRHWQKLNQERNKLRIQLHRADYALEAEWNVIERKWQRLNKQTQNVNIKFKAWRPIITTSIAPSPESPYKLLADVKSGYRNIRKKLNRASHNRHATG
jgi:hypothetical protein